MVAASPQGQQSILLVREASDRRLLLQQAIHRRRQGLPMRSLILIACFVSSERARASQSDVASTPSPERICSAAAVRRTVSTGSP